MPGELNIRSADIADAPRISELIITVAHYFSSDNDGGIAKWFLDSVLPSAVEGYIRNENYNYLVASSGRVLAGVISVRDKTHVHHLFVAPDFHRQGVAMRLWERAKADAVSAGNNEGFFVRSSEYAVAVYERFGFRVAGARAEKNGIAFVPMRLDLAWERNGGNRRT